MHRRLDRGCFEHRSAQEGSSKLQVLPAAVRQAVEKETRGDGVRPSAVIKNVSKETENGKTVYEVETTVDGRTRDIVFAADGAVLVVEEQASLDSIPEAARRAIEKRAAGGRISTVELVKTGSTVTYEAIVVAGGKKTEVVSTPTGRQPSEPARAASEEY